MKTIMSNVLSDGDIIAVGVQGNRNKITKTQTQIINNYYISQERTSSSFLPESTYLELDKENIVNRSQYISVINFQDNVLYLEDAKGRLSTVEIHLKNNTLFCQNDGSFECVHVRFAHALPEVKIRLKE